MAKAGPNVGAKADGSNASTTHTGTRPMTAGGLGSQAQTRAQG